LSTPLVPLTFRRKHKPRLFVCMDLRFSRELSPKQIHWSSNVTQVGRKPKHINEKPPVKFCTCRVLIDLVKRREALLLKIRKSVTRRSVLSRRESPEIKGWEQEDRRLSGSASTLL
jgi:hypothetical protein